MSDNGAGDRLREIEAAVTTGLELQCQLLERRAGDSIDSLAVLLESDRTSRPRIANLSFLPVADDDVQEVHLLQLQCLLPVAIATASRSDLERFLTRTNSIVPLGAFSITVEDELVFKYVHAVGRTQPLEPAEFLELFLLWMFTLDSLSGVVEDIAVGARSADAALAELS